MDSDSAVPASITLVMLAERPVHSLHKLSG